MLLFQELRSLSPVQRNTFIACLLGWTLDAFDFFLLTLCVKAIAADFHTGIQSIAEAIFWTLIMRPLGALIFGVMAEKFGRRPTLMLNIVSFSLFGLASALAPTLHTFLLCRALFGIAMGGEWGVGAALAFETLPAEGRGFFSGLLQEGYVLGNLLAAAVYGLLFSHLHGTGIFTSWRVLFMIGSLPALLAFYLRFRVDESPVWLAAKQKRLTESPQKTAPSPYHQYLLTFLFIALLMTAFTSFSHGSQDLYPTFLEKDNGLSPGRVGLVVSIANIGALFGGIAWGTVSEKFGRKRAIVAASLLALPMVPLWAWSHSIATLAAGGFLMQFMIQGAWGVIPAYLNELSPSPVRAIFPGVAYQTGNLVTSRNSVFQVALANRHYGGLLAPVLSGTVIVVALAVALITSFGKEAKGADLTI